MGSLPGTASPVQISLLALGITQNRVGRGEREQAHSKGYGSVRPALLWKEASPTHSLALKGADPFYPRTSNCKGLSFTKKSSDKTMLNLQHSG